MDFTFDKAVSEIEAPVALPESWYTMMVKDVKLEANKAKKENPLSEKAGDNIVVQAEVVSDQEDASGRLFFIYLAFPNEKDKSAFTPMGQKVYDSKMGRIVNFVEAASGEPCDPGLSGVQIEKGQMFQAYVTQELAENQEDILNRVDIFQGFKPVPVF